ncbi:hypothetical protein MPTK1_1g23520 [Marchantia polymorpha subsp. ruderalis]|uniref:DUF4378 domain-containing protein n=2 Tax=Marchantia polymorpha TaxID=3197 RepID=A0A176WPB4_MARPO|nr:hypothetical protein AXG93_1864s1250 [Marchantia polymorpha subsp. ruderalis]PTQ36212.1 hypothetical protein MARPO_0065s0025 [Marchantia polymorpha]BBM99743.1 hypothetical protein Mp_1g23520 [Marchantia polymorpha subsp. ruderalis]|eukprot:PTQ36212.1 hypothetical protein MARPO_0065s0025 [Marchantia polymorpha]
MDYPRVDRHRSQGYDVKTESPRTPHYLKEHQRAPYDSATTPRSSAANALRSSLDGRDMSRSSLDIKDIVRASFLRERARTSVDRESSQRSSVEPRERESPRFGSLKLKDPPRLSMDGRGGEGRAETPRSLSSPRLSVRLKEAVRAAVEGRGEHLRSSSESSEVLGGSVPRSRDTPRSSSESRLLVELRESPRLSRDAPRYSCDGRDVLRLSVDSSKDTLRAAAQRARDSPRLSVDGRGSPRLSRELVSSGHAKEAAVVNSSQLQSLRSEIDGRDQLAAEQRRRVPSLVARLMGLEDLPDDQHSTLLSTTPPKKPSKESKILKGLLQYTPLTEIKPTTERRPVDLHNVDFYKSRPLKSPSENAASHPSAGSQTVWKANQEPLGHLKLSPRQLGVEAMPSAFKQQETREIGALRHKVVQTIPKQLTEAVLTVLKHSDDSKRMPMSYADMENRLRQLRLRSSLQEHKTLRQILEAMQMKGLLNAPSRSKEASEEVKESRQQVDPRQQTTPRHIMLPKSQDYSSESTKVRNLQELRKLGSKLQDQVFGSNGSEGTKVSRPQLQPVSKAGNDVDQSLLEASIVVMKPIGKPVKKSRAQNPAMLVESMPGARSPQGGRESSGKSSPWGSPVNRPARTQPGYGFGREPTNRFNSEESASFKRRDRIIARGAREIQSEPSTPRSPKLISLPQPTGKLRLSGSKEAPEKPSNKMVSSSGSKNGESRNGENSRRSRSTVTKEKEEPSKLLSSSLRSQSSRDLLGLRKSALETEPTKVLRRSNSDGKIQFPVDKERLAGSPPEVTVLRTRSSSGKSRVSSSDNEAPGTPTKKKLVLSGAKPSVSGERTKDKSSSATSATQGSTTPRSLSRNMAAEFAKKKEEQICSAEPRMQVRVTDGDATEQSSVRTPLVGLTNRLQNAEVGDLEQRDNQGLRTPRGSILVKKVLSNQEDDNLVAEIIDMVADQAQPSPISVLDSAAFQEDFSPLQLSKSLDPDEGLYNNAQSITTQIVQEADTALQDSVKGAFEAVSAVENNVHQLLLLRDSSKIVPPQGEDKVIALQENEERIYVRDVLLVSGATMGIKAVNPTGNPIDSTVYDYLEEKKGIADFGWEKKIDGVRDSVKCEGEKARQAMDRRMLFDTVNDILTTMLVPYVNVKPWIQGLVLPPLRKRPSGQRLVQEVWDELQALPPREPCDDICDSLYIILQKDLTLPLNAWTSFSEEVEEVGLEIERMIFKELVDEMVCYMSHTSVGNGLSEL